MGTSFSRRVLLRGGLNAVSVLAIGSAVPGIWPALRAQAGTAGSDPTVRHLDGFTVHGPAEGAGQVTEARTTGRPFTMVGLTVPQGGEVSLRASVDGKYYGPWQRVRELAMEGEGPDGLEAREAGARWRTMSHLLWTGPARWLQLAIRGAAPEEIDAVLLDSSMASTDATVIKLASTVPAPSRSRQDDEPDTVPDSLGLRVVTRAEWGADEKLRGEPAYASRVLHGVVHHTVSSNSYTAAQAPAIVRSIYHYHAVTLGWNDIGYNLLVDRFGVVYEGRFGGVDQPVIGAHARGVNTGSFGVAVIGDFSTAPLPAAAQEALLRVLTAKFMLHAIDPLATVTAENGLQIPTLVGHRDVGATACPGEGIQQRLPAFRSELARMVGTGFRDVRGDVHEQSIVRVREAGVTQGFSDGTFRPSDPVTRGQMATFFTRAGKFPPVDELWFDDVGTNHVHRAGIGAAAGAGVARGYPDGTFRPDDAVTRGQMASFVVRAQGLTEQSATFTDVPLTHPHAGAIGAVARAGIAEGFGDGTFRPNTPITRGQMACFLVRAFSL